MYINSSRYLYSVYSPLQIYMCGSACALSQAYYRLTVDGLTVDRLTVDGLTVDRLTVDGLTVDRLTVDRLTIDRLTTDLLCVGLLCVGSRRVYINHHECQLTRDGGRDAGARRGRYSKRRRVVL
ncbi:hypothetical protein K504DRAFT_451808 [Pleomassaria siparia CBS 279.74]|uniref:Uncharacterized protein n=1 Tax=Pleomassaria siparia CBS 279.74 TaxID=1314801 RepID=A0A6G1JT13_9PLEO|nr:hypothetical protein K504DRAFT_451808 [Pleomassaria siparia CBS 279.74]